MDEMFSCETFLIAMNLQKKLNNIIWSYKVRFCDLEENVKCKV